MLLFIQSILVYGFMIWVMTYWGKVAYHRQYPYGLNGRDAFPQKVSLLTFLSKNYFVLPILIFSLLCAVRYRVGVDSEGYKKYFYDFLTFGKTGEGAVEWGFEVLAKFTTSLTDSHYLLFFILAFLQIFFLYYTFRKRTNVLVYLGCAIMLSGCYLSLMNGVRQNIVACAFVAMIPFVLKKWDWWKFFVCVCIASLMHTSAFVLLPIGIIAYFCRFNILDVKWQLLLVAICYVMMDKIPIESLTSLFELGARAGYDEHDIEAYSNVEITSKSFGLYSMLQLGVHLLCIINSKKIQEVFHSEIFNVYYNLFFIGICMSLLFYNNFTMGRLLYYLNIFIPIIISMLLFTMRFTKGRYHKFYSFSTFFFMSISILYIFYLASGNSVEYTLFKFDLFR